MSDVIKVLENTNKPVNQEFQIKIYLSKMGERIPQWLRIHASTMGSSGSIPDQGTEIYIYIAIYLYIYRYIYTKRKL